MAAEDPIEFPVEGLVTSQLNYGFNGGNDACHRLDVPSR